MNSNYKHVNTAINPFDLFNLSPNFLIDTTQLQNTYKNLLKQFHPDNFAQATNKEKLIATQISANIITCYALLCDPVKRGEFLLNNHGCNINLETIVNQDQQLMIEQMNYREILENCTNIQQLNDFEAKINTQYQQILNDFSDKISKKLLEQAKQLLLKMRFNQKLLSQISEKQQQIKLINKNN